MQQPPNPHNPSNVPLDQLPAGWRYLDVSETTDRLTRWEGDEVKFKAPGYMEEVNYWGPLNGRFYTGVVFSPFYLKYTAITNAPLPAHLAAPPKPPASTRWPHWDSVCKS